MVDCWEVVPELAASAASAASAAETTEILFVLLILLTASVVSSYIRGVCEASAAACLWRSLQGSHFLQKGENFI